MKYLRTAFVAIMLIAGLSACGDDDPVGPGGGADVHAITFNFRMDQAAINGPVASAQFDVPTITRSVVDGGAVLAYFREQDTWTAMPYTFGEESPDLAAVDYTLTLGYAYDDALLEIFYEASSSEAVDLAAQPDRQIKVVIIDGVVLSKTGMDVRNYDEVAAYFGLE